MLQQKSDYVTFSHQFQQQNKKVYFIKTTYIILGLSLAIFSILKCISRSPLWVLKVLNILQPGYMLLLSWLTKIFQWNSIDENDMWRQATGEGSSGELLAPNLVSHSDLPEIWFINLLDILENPIYFNNHKRIEMVEGPVIMIDLC